MTVNELIRRLEEVPPELRDFSQIDIEIRGEIRRDGGRAVHRISLTGTRYEREGTTFVVT